MRYSLVLTGMAASMAAGQTIDLSSISSAAAAIPVATGPAVTATAETIVYQPAATGSAAVTATAYAQVGKRGGVEARTFNLLCQIFGRNCPATTTKASTTSCTTTTKAASATSTGAVTTTKAGSSSAASTTGAASTSAASSTTSTSTVTTYTSWDWTKPTPPGIPSSCTNTWTNTFEFTSATDCPTIFETGTYCGFINPEDPCAAQPAGSGPVASPDTTDAFLNSAELKNIALSAKTPSGYAQTFQNLQGSTSAVSYLGLTTLTSYDVAACAAACDNKETCSSFNIYAERDPSLAPSTTYCCPNPASLTNYKCTLWGSVIDATTATNTGSNREDFEVRITASNGYTKANTTAPVTPPGWSNPKPCNGAHSHQQTCIGQHFFPGPYDPKLCASYAEAQNIKNGAGTGRGSSKSRCNFFNSYMLKKDNKPLGTYCSLFAQQYDSSEATYVPGWQGKNFYGVETSYSYCLN
jgi:hypothetical protein